MPCGGLPTTLRQTNHDATTRFLFPFGQVTPVCGGELPTEKVVLMVAAMQMLAFVVGLTGTAQLLGMEERAGHHFK